MLIGNAQQQQMYGERSLNLLENGLIKHMICVICGRESLRNWINMSRNVTTIFRNIWTRRNFVIFENKFESPIKILQNAQKTSRGLIVSLINL